MINLDLIYFCSEDEPNDRFGIGCHQGFMASYQSFSQHGQDRYIYQNLIKEPRKGVFLDIGAYDGLTYSNTFFFEKYFQWEGICIEPLPQAFQTLIKNRQCICLNCAVSDFEGISELTIATMPRFGLMYSGLSNAYDPKHIELIERYATETQQIAVQVRTVSNILAEHPYSQINYLSLDTEGSELLILTDMFQSLIFPEIISVENNYADESLHQLLTEYEYTLAHVFNNFDYLYIQEKDE